MTGEPLISVIMPVFNAAPFLRESIESVLNQTYKNFEFLIFDDDSSDNSVDIIRSYKHQRIQLFINKTNLGIAETLNQGLRIAKGQYVARMDADDISFPERFEKQAAFLEAHPDIQLAGTQMLIFSDDITRTHLRSFPTDSDSFRARLLFYTGCGHPTVMFRRALIDRGLYVYNIAYTVAQDYELWTRLALQDVNMSNIDEPLLYCRMSSTHVTYTKKSQQLDNVNKARQFYTEHYLAGIKTDWYIYTTYWFKDRMLSAAQFKEFIRFYTVLADTVQNAVFLKEMAQNIYYVALNNSASFQSLIDFNQSVFGKEKRIGGYHLLKKGGGDVSTILNAPKRGRVAEAAEKKR